MNENIFGEATNTTLLAPSTLAATAAGLAVDFRGWIGTALATLMHSVMSGATAVTNGTFGSDSGWTKGVGWTIGSGKADCDGTQVAVSDLSQNASLTAGQVCKVVYTISSYSAGTLTPRIGGTAGTARTANGTYTEYITCGSGGHPEIEFRADADFIGKLDDVAVYNETLAVKFQKSVDADLIGTVTYAGTGNGTCTQVEALGAAVTENVTVTFSGATSAAVVGSVSGALGTATVGTVFSCSQITFLLTAGTTAFINTDAFTIPVTARTWTDISGATFTDVTMESAAAIQHKALNLAIAGRWIRPYYTLTGTTPSLTVGLSLSALKKTRP